MSRRSVVALTAFAVAAIPTAAMASGAHAGGTGSTPSTAHGTASPLAQGTKVVPGVLAGLSRARRLGSAPAGQDLSIGVGLARPDASGENALIAAEYNPTSSDYHHFLTPAQFNARFGVKPATVSATTHWLTGQGLSIQSVSADGDYLMASGRVSQIDKLLDVSIGDYRDSKDGTFFANNQAPRVPAALPITAVLGLNDVQQMVPSSLHSTPLTPTVGRASRGQGTRSTTAAGTYSGVLEPRDLWKIYNQPTSDEGQGQKIGIFGEGETDSVVTQLRLFEHKEGFPKIPVRVVHTEGGSNDSYSDNTGSIEWYLDVQASTGMAPKASQIDLYFAKSLFDADIAKDFSAWADDPNGPKQMNASFGECETDPTNPVTGPLAQIPYGTELGDELEPVGEGILKQAVAEGRTLFASAGDTGSGCPEVVVPVAGAGNGVAPQPLPIANYPSASQYAVGVGGTVIQTDGSDHGKLVSEQAWMDTGGGPSHFLTEPDFQKKTSYITFSNAPCLTDRNGTPYTPGTICRGTPDVAALSGNILGNGYFIYIDGEPSSEGGTSLSSPLTMGMWSRLQAAAKSSGGLGFAADTLYAQADKGASTYARDFRDITATDTQGEVGVSTTNGFYPAEPGYDYVSGLGSMNVGNLLTDVDGTQAARHPDTSPEAPSVVRNTVTLHSPEGNADNPIDVQAGNQPAIDITKVTATTAPSAKTLTATMTGPGLSATPDPTATGGDNYYLYWRYHSTVYYVVAHTSQGSSPTFSSGKTIDNEYVDNSNSKATGSFTGHTLRMTVPLSEVGSPPRHALLDEPAAFTQLGVGAPVGVGTIQLLALTADSASSPSVAAANRGEALCVGCVKAAKSSHASGKSGSNGTSSTSHAASSSSLADTGLDGRVPMVALALLALAGVGAALRRRSRIDG